MIKRRFRKIYRLIVFEIDTRQLIIIVQVTGRAVEIKPIRKRTYK